MCEVVKSENLPSDDSSAESTYLSIRSHVVEAQQQVCSTVNSVMVEAYWKIGKAIFQVCGELDRDEFEKLQDF